MTHFKKELFKEIKKVETTEEKDSIVSWVATGVSKILNININKLA